MYFISRAIVAALYLTVLQYFRDMFCQNDDNVFEFVKVMHKIPMAPFSRHSVCVYLNVHVILCLL